MKISNRLTHVYRGVRAPVSWFGAVLAIFGVLWSGPSLAVSGCLAGGATNKLCLSLTSIPGDSVQPSQLAGTPTYVKYTATLSNTELATSRFVGVTFDLSPVSGFVSFTAEGGTTCSMSGSQVSCFVDKLDRFDPQTITLVAEAPLYTTQATQLVNTAVFGFQGNTATVSKSVAVSSTSGSSFVPAGEEVTIVSEKETENPADQVTAENPLFAKATLPPQPVDTYAKISIITNGPLNSNCETGVFLTPWDGGPYLCRATGHRWAEFDVGVTEGAQLPAPYGATNPMQFTMIWDSSVISPDQQPPNEVFTTGVPSFAVFYAQPERTPYPDSVAARAFADLCSTLNPLPPCLTGVTRLESGDWLASGIKVNDGTDIPTPLDQFQEVLGSLLMIGVADAGSLTPPIM
jgi:hypothetical protein